MRMSFLFDVCVSGLIYWFFFGWLIGALCLGIQMWPTVCSFEGEEGCKER